MSLRFPSIYARSCRAPVRQYVSDSHDDRKTMDDLRRRAMPLTAKGEEIRKHLEQEYGAKKGEQVLYAGKNKGTFTGIDSRGDAELSEGDRVKHKVSGETGTVTKINKDADVVIVSLKNGGRSQDKSSQFTRLDADETKGEQASEDARMSAIEGRLSEVEGKKDAEDVFDSIPAGLDPAKLDTACSMMDALDKRCDEFFKGKRP